MYRVVHGKVSCVLLQRMLWVKVLSEDRSPRNNAMILRLKFLKDLRHHSGVHRGMLQAAELTNVQLLYKSDNFIVVNKHYDLKINSDESADTITVATQLANRYPQHVDADIPHSFRFVHRLDFSTSGALCIALNKAASTAASREFMARRVQKEYLALVRGHVSQDHIIVNKGIYPNPEEGFTHMMCVSEGNDPDGIKVKSAKTDIFVLQRGHYDGDPVTKVQLVPVTGRRHQLRVHCLSVGHPVVGDYTYSNRKDIKPYRMMLHSHKLNIPAAIENVNVTAPDPFLPEIDPKWVVDR